MKSRGMGFLALQTLQGRPVEKGVRAVGQVQNLRNKSMGEGLPCPSNLARKTLEKGGMGGRGRFKTCPYIGLVPTRGFCSHAWGGRGRFKTCPAMGQPQKVAPTDVGENSGANL
jgi:hypothetical protein